MAIERHKNWAPDRGTFRQLLQWLDEGYDSNGTTYLDMRRKLVDYFDRKNCTAPDALADETLNRVARRLEEEGGITDTTPARYCYITARYVYLESRRSLDARTVPLREGPDAAAPSRLGQVSWIAQPDNREVRHRCLDRCLERLRPSERTLIIEYYRGYQREKIENRRDLADRLGMNINALSIRAYRLRGQLKECVSKCCGRVDMFPEIRLKPEG